MSNIRSAQCVGVPWQGNCQLLSSQGTPTHTELTHIFFIYNILVLSTMFFFKLWIKLCCHLSNVHMSFLCRQFYSHLLVLLQHVWKSEFSSFKDSLCSSLPKFSFQSFVILLLNGRLMISNTYSAKLILDEFGALNSKCIFFLFDHSFTCFVWCILWLSRNMAIGYCVSSNL